MSEPTWVEVRALLMLHEGTIAEHGGPSGLRDAGLLDSALARPRNLFAYNPEADSAQLAAAYGFGLVRNHPFLDGNKRIAFIATHLFLHLNGLSLEAEPIDQIHAMLRLAANEISEEEFAAWIREHMKKRD
jgi:death on curing protein